jgi:hypothetical protein
VPFESASIPAELVRNIAEFLQEFLCRILVGESVQPHVIEARG